MTVLIASLPFLLCFQNCSGNFQSAKYTELSSSSGEDNQPERQIADGEAPGSVPGGQTTDPSPELPPARPEMKSVIMATGHVGRTVMSCDGGLTWINDRSDNDATRCWVTGDPNYLECDHTPTSGHGVAFGEGAFYANFGWGYNGSVRKSIDGKNWTTLRTDGWGGGIAYVKNTVFLLWGTWQRSLDQGLTWAGIQNSPAYMIDHPLLFRFGEQLIAAGRYEIGVSDDQGVTWTLPTSYQRSWGGGNFAKGNGVIVGMTTSWGTSPNPNVLYAVRSADSGKTWTGQQLATGAGQTWDSVVFNGTHFVAWSRGLVYKSMDGMTWTSAPLVSTGTYLKQWFSGPITYDPGTKNYIAIPRGALYDKQRALISSDGFTWTPLDVAKFKGGHPIYDFAFGVLESKYCN